jgi:hypothetical protein
MLLGSLAVCEIISNTTRRTPWNRNENRWKFLLHDEDDPRIQRGKLRERVRTDASMKLEWKDRETRRRIYTYSFKPLSLYISLSSAPSKKPTFSLPPSLFPYFLSILRSSRENVLRLTTLASSITTTKPKRSKSLPSLPLLTDRKGWQGCRRICCYSGIKSFEQMR